MNFCKPFCLGGYHSPDSEGCKAGLYQLCEADGRWSAGITPIEGAVCQ